MTNQIILIDHDDQSRQKLDAKLNELGYGVVLHAATFQEACRRMDDNPTIALALIDMNMPDMDGLDILDHMKNSFPGTECIMVTAINEARIAVACLKKGAYDYLIKPVTKEVLAITLPKALERKRLLDILDMKKRRDCPSLTNPEPFSPIIARSPVMRRLLKEAELLAASDLPVLITGESGTGKELLAWAIHQASLRSEYPFTPINMASISSHLFEAAFFNPHPQGAAAVRFLENNNNGTLFLDEIGDLSLALQGQLLRLLQEGEFSRLGSKDRVVVNVRIIAATNEDLDAMMARNAFRKDLYYCIRSGWLHLPPLRERTEDIPVLISSILNKYRFPNTKGLNITSQALELLVEHAWPGNIRELKTALHNAVLSGDGDDTITEKHLPEYIRHATRRRPYPQSASLSHPMRSLADVEKSHILNTYHHLDRNKVRTAKTLQIGLNTLRRKLAAYGEK